MKVSTLRAKGIKQTIKPTVTWSMVKTWGPISSFLNFVPLRFISRSYHQEINPLDSSWWIFSLKVTKREPNNGNMMVNGIVYKICSNNSSEVNPLRYTLLFNNESCPVVAIIVPLLAGSAIISKHFIRSHVPYFMLSRSDSKNRKSFSKNSFDSHCTIHIENRFHVSQFGIKGEIVFN